VKLEDVLGIEKEYDDLDDIDDIDVDDIIKETEVEDAEFIKEQNDVLNQDIIDTEITPSNKDNLPSNIL